MKNLFFCVAAVLTAALVLSCSKDDDGGALDAKIVGKWDNYLTKSVNKGSVREYRPADYGNICTYEFYEDNTAVRDEYENGRWETPDKFVYSVDGSVLKLQRVDEDGTIDEDMDCLTIKKLTSREMELYIIYPDEDDYEMTLYFKRL